MSLNGRQDSAVEELRRANRERTEELLRSIRRACYYPAAVFVVSSVLVVALLYFFVPAFVAGVS